MRKIYFNGMHFLKSFSMTLAALMITLEIFATTDFENNRTDFRDESIYFAMTTRFYDGDPSNNTQCWDAQNYNVGDPAWRGDFKGLIEKLDYIKALGFTAIWITPIVENASGYDYHGYHASNFSKVDHRYESEDVTLETLVNACHAKGIKLVVDIVLQHTGNFGEENLCKMFNRNWKKPQCNLDASMVPATVSTGGNLPDNYLELEGGKQYAARLALMKNTQGKNQDTHNYWHHFGNFNWDDATRWFAQIAGDCVDLNTENPAVYNYIANCYKSFIALGVDGFRIDTGGHIPRLTFNNGFLPQFIAAGEEYKNKRTLYGSVPAKQAPFFMYAEVCARYGNIHYREHPALSAYYYTWKENKSYAWDSDASSWDGITAMEGDACESHTNWASCWEQWNDDKDNISSQPQSNNALLNGNDYHTPDYSKYSGLSVIDFPMHHNFVPMGSAWAITSAENDRYYNDATFNVTYVDSHDYAPNGAPEDARFSKGEEAWAEDLCLLFTMRGIPCIYYGSEIEFKKGMPIDKGPNCPLNETGRAYFGGYIKGTINVTDFAEYSNAKGNIAQTLSHPLAQHIQRLNKIRQAVPALRKGQYSKDNCSGSYAFKRRYTDDTTDSFVLICINGNGTFKNLPGGTYVDCVTGDSKVIAEGGTLSATCSGTGNMRVYVLSTTKTPAPGKIGVDGKYLYTSSAASIPSPSWDGTEEELATVGGTCEPIVAPVVTMTPAGGNVGEGGTVTLTTTKGTIYYTTDGTDPSQSSTAYSSPIVINTNKTTVKAIAYDTDGNESNVVTGVFYTREMPTVTLSPEKGLVGPNGQVTITSNLASAQIYYTTDGTNPTKSSTLYTGPVTITENKTVVKAIAYDGEDASEIVSGKFYTEQSGINVEFKAPTGWSKVNIYVWTDDKTKLAGEWPGKAISKEGDYYTYSIETEDEKVNVIFNNGSEQTADLVAEDGSCWDASSNTGTKFTPKTCGGEPVPTTAIVIRVKKEGAFASTTPNIYFWGNGAPASWPGNKMTSENENWWKYEIECTTGTTNVIFNNGSQQTGNIEGVKKNTCYTVSSSFSASEVECPSTAIDEAEAHSVALYPNPTTGIVNIAADIDVEKVKVMSLNGITVLEANETNVIDMTSQPTSIYFVEVTLTDGTSVIRKVIKK